MKPKLTDLRTAMDKSVFNERRFTNHQKQQILNRISKKERNRTWLPQSLSIAFSLVLLLSIGYLLFGELNGFQDAPMQQGDGVAEQPPVQEAEPVEPPAIVAEEEEAKEPIEEEAVEPEKPVPAGELFELTAEEAEAYEQFRENFDTAHLAALEPISVAKLYIFAGYNQEYEVEYELLTDRDEYIMWDNGYHLDIPKEDHAAPEMLAAAYRNFEQGTFIQTGDFEGYIEFNPTETKEPEEVKGFRMIQNEDGVWQISFMPVQ